MPARLGLLGPERRSEAVHLAERRRRRLDVELTGLGEVGLAEIEVIGTEQLPGLLADGAGEDRSVHQGEVALEEEIADGLDDLVTHLGDRHLPSAPQPEVPVLKEKLGAVLLGLNRELGTHSEDLQIAHVHLVATGRARLGAHRARERHRGLLGQRGEPLPDGLRHFLAGQHPLQVAGAVADDDERDLSAGADVAHPPLDRHGEAFVAGQLGDTGVRHDRCGRGERLARRGAWSLAVTVVMVNAGCAGFRPDPEFDPGDARPATAIAGTPLTRLWASRPVRGPSAPIATDSLNAYLGGSDRRVVAVDLQSGRTRWAHRVAGPLVGGVLVDGAVLYAATDRPEGRVHAFSVRSGNELWSTRTGYVQTPIALIEGMLLVSTREGQLLALRPGDGKIAWRRRLLPNRTGALAVGGGQALIVSFDSLYLLRMSDGTVTRRRRATGTATSPWILVGSALVSATGDSLVIAIDPDSLTERWRVRLDGPILNSPVAIGDTIYAVTQAGAIHRCRRRGHAGGIPAARPRLGGHGRPRDPGPVAAGRSVRWRAPRL